MFRGKKRKQIPQRKEKCFRHYKIKAKNNKNKMLTLALGPGDVSIMSMLEEPGITWVKNKEIRSQMLHLRFGETEKKVSYFGRTERVFFTCPLQMASAT